MNMLMKLPLSLTKLVYSLSLHQIAMSMNYVGRLSIVQPYSDVCWRESRRLIKCLILSSKRVSVCVSVKRQVARKVNIPISLVYSTTYVKNCIWSGSIVLIRTWRYCKSVWWIGNEFSWNEICWSRVKDVLGERSARVFAHNLLFV
jgi:hypothetical protein